MTARIPKGEINNNPGNLRFDVLTQWLGQTGHDADGFCIFDDSLHGLRALCRVLLNYQRLDGLRSIERIVTRYAPASENDTAAYIASVAQHTGLGADQFLDLTDAGELRNLARAIVLQECGRVVYAPELFAEAAALALAP